MSVSGVGGGRQDYNVDDEGGVCRPEDEGEKHEVSASYTTESGVIFEAHGEVGGPEAEAESSSGTEGPALSHSRTIGEGRIGRHREVGEDASSDPESRMSLYSVKGEAEAHASVAHAGGGFSVRAPDGSSVSADGRVDLLYAGAGAEGSAGVSTDGVYAEGRAHAEADLVHVQGHATVSSPEVTVGGVGFHGQRDLEVEGGVGAEAHAEGSIEVGPGGAAVRLEAGASAGARIEATATDSIVDDQGRSLFGVGVTAHGTAGAEAEAHLDAGFEDGHIRFSAGAGAALGLGGGLDVNVDINVGAIADDAVQMIQNEAEAISSAVDDAARAIEDTASRAADAATEAVADGLDAAASALSSAADEIRSWF